MTGRSSVLTVEQIPTLNELYASGTLDPHPSETPSASYHCNSSLNNRISLIKCPCSETAVRTLQADNVQMTLPNCRST